MDRTPTQGMRVQTPFGPGSVERSDRAYAYVHPDNARLGVTIRLSIGELTPLDSEDHGAESAAPVRNAETIGLTAKALAPGPGPLKELDAADDHANRPAPPQASPTHRAIDPAQYSSDQRDAFLSIEALRFGLVPRQRIEDLTLNFDDLESWVLERLPDANQGKPQVSEIWGPFGTGKSHTMQVVRHIAEQRGYVTAKVEVDGTIVSLSDPENLLFSLWTTVSARGIGSARFLLDLNLQAISNGHSPPPSAPDLIDRIAGNFATAKLLKQRGLVDEHGYALNAIMSSSDEFTAYEVGSQIWSEPNVYGPDVTVKRMIGRRLADRPGDFIHALAGYSLVAQLADYQGLVVTIDEFEVEEQFLTREKLNRVARLLGALTNYLSGGSNHPVAPLSIFVATVGQEGHVGDTIIEGMLEATNGAYYPLEERGQSDRLKLARRIHAIYCEAYGLDGMDFEQDTVDSIEARLERSGAADSGIIRSFIKRYVSALDSQFGPPR